MAQTVKNLLAVQETCLVSIPGSGRSPGEGNGNPLQHSCLENPMDRGYRLWGRKGADMTECLLIKYVLEVLAIQVHFKVK